MASEQANESGKRVLKVKGDKINNNKVLIIEYLKKNIEDTSLEISKILNLIQTRTRVILSNMKDVEPIGATNTRKYTLR